MITQDSGDETNHDLDPLRACRLELARLRVEQESWAEDLAKERRRRRAAEKKLQALSAAVDEHLSTGDSGPRETRSLLSRVRSAHQAIDPLEEEERLIQSSQLFRGAWYVRHYPQSVLTGLSPARHYLEIGASAGHDPGPKFKTKDYVDSHPELMESKQNPLVHFLTRQPGERPRAGATA